MRHILADEQREVLAQLSWSNVLLGFDFDGTLAPIVDDPERAALQPGTRRHLAELAALYPCVVISGRSVRDVERRVGGLGLRAIIGNHGLEPWRATRELELVVERWRELLDRLLAGLPGVEIEDKTYSLAVHYRRSRQKKRARTAILLALGQLDGVRLIGGKQVVNAVPIGAPHKGMALERERDHLGCDTALFVGDDETDEDVFALERPGRLVTVRVGTLGDSQASYCLRSQTEIDDLMERLIALRRDGLTRRKLAR
jgi:trehalose 6-phosphate phosphatase